jgi:hypothetical protein
MYKVRIKKNARPGDQIDFSLHTGLDAVHAPGVSISPEKSVRHTMGAVPRNEANIEVEGGETVVGDVNKDGYIDHFFFEGKRHSQGGMPVNIPEGSFIFSDTKKLSIKDKALLKESFNKSMKKGGYTPAQIAKQYKLNNFVEMLKDEGTDHISKQTANLMIQKNLKKLGELALVQESMKGFSDGIPAIAQFAMGGEEDSQGQPSEMKYGGKVLKKMNKGGGTAGRASETGQKSYAQQGLEGAQRLWNYLEEEGIQRRNTSTERYNKLVQEQKAAKEAEDAKRAKIREESNGKNPFSKSAIRDNISGNPSQKASLLSVEDAEKLYKQAVASGDPAKMIEASITIDNLKNSPWYSWQVIPGSDESVFENMKNDLLKQANMQGKRQSFDQSFLPLKETVSTISASVQKRRNEILNDLDMDFSEKKAELQRLNRFNEIEKKVKDIERKQQVSSNFANNVNSVEKYGDSYGAKELAGYLQELKTNYADFTSLTQAKNDTQIPPQAVAANQGVPYVFSQNAQGQSPTRATAVSQTVSPQLPADQGAVTASPKGQSNAPATQKPTGSAAYKKVGKFTIAEDQEIIGYLKKGGSVMNKYTGGGGVNEENAKVVIVKNRDNTYSVIDQGKNEVFRTYKNPGNMTPGGMESSYPEMSAQDFYDWFKGWTTAMGVEPDQIKSNDDFQKRMYTHILENDPDSLDTVWGEIGLNTKALSDKGLLTNLIESGAYNPETKKIDFSKVNPESKKALYSQMAPYYADGMIGVRSLNLKAPSPKQEQAAESPADEKPPVDTRGKGDTSAEGISAEPFDKAPVKKTGPWYIQDQANFMATMTDPIRRYEPLLSRFDMRAPDTVFMDPSRTIAASQEQQARMNDMFSNSLDPNVAASMAIGASGEAFGNVANVISQVENQNVGIANQAAANQAQMENEQSMMNANALQKYVGENAILNQNIDNSIQNRKYRRLAAWNQGMNNWQRKKLMEQVLFPQVWQDPISGDIDYSGNERDPFGVDTYMNPVTNSAGTNPQDLINAQMQNFESRLQAIQGLRKRGYSDEDIKFAMGAGMGRSSNQFNDRLNYMNAMQGVMPNNTQIIPEPFQ